MNISREIEISAGPARVWEILIDPAVMGEWLLEPEGFLPIVGNKFILHSECEGEKTKIYCEVLAMLPERTITFSWVDSTIGLNSVVKIELHAHGDVTLVSLIQSGWTEEDSTKRMHEETWGLCLKLLNKVARRCKN